jgi:hypothetical protein
MADLREHRSPGTVMVHFSPPAVTMKLLEQRAQLALPSEQARLLELTIGDPAEPPRDAQEGRGRIIVGGVKSTLCDLIIDAPCAL